jgi:uncharacterized protein involved in tolerance to divalent cations
MKDKYLIIIHIKDKIKTKKLIFFLIKNFDIIICNIIVKKMEIFFTYKEKICREKIFILLLKLNRKKNLKILNNKTHNFYIK